MPCSDVCLALASEHRVCRQNVYQLPIRFAQFADSENRQE